MAEDLKNEVNNSGALSWITERLKEPSSAIGLMLIAGSVGINLTPDQSAAILMICMAIGGFLGFVMKEQNQVISEDTEHHKRVDWKKIKLWLFDRISEPSSRIGITMVLGAFGMYVSPDKVNAILGITMLLGGSAGFITKEAKKLED